MKVFKFFKEKPYFEVGEKMGLLEETIFKHVWNEDLEMYERDGFHTEAIWLLILAVAVAILWISIVLL